MIAGPQGPVPCVSVEGVIETKCPGCPPSHTLQQPRRGTEGAPLAVPQVCPAGARAALLLLRDSYTGLHPPSGLQTLSSRSGGGGTSKVCLTRAPCANEHGCALLSLLQAQAQPLFASSDNVSAWETVGRADTVGPAPG